MFKYSASSFFAKFQTTEYNIQGASILITALCAKYKKFSH